MVAFYVEAAGHTFTEIAGDSAGFNTVERVRGSVVIACQERQLLPVTGRARAPTLYGTAYGAHLAREGGAWEWWWRYEWPDGSPPLLSLYNPRVTVPIVSAVEALTPAAALARINAASPGDVTRVTASAAYIGIRGVEAEPYPASTEATLLRGLWRLYAASSRPWWYDESRHGEWSTGERLLPCAVLVVE